MVLTEPATVAAVAAAAVAAAVAAAAAAAAVAAAAAGPAAVLMSWTSGPPHLHRRCFASRTPAAGWGRNILRSGRPLNILEPAAAAAVNQVGETRAAESLVGTSQAAVCCHLFGRTHAAELVPVVALDPGNP